MEIGVRNEDETTDQGEKEKEGAASTSKQAQATETSALSTLFSAQTWREKDAGDVVDEGCAPMRRQSPSPKA